MDHPILIYFLFIIVIIGLVNIFIDEHKEKEEKEEFVDDYYYWNWNDPMMLTRINSIDPKCKDKHCKYSISCDFTDDALPHCYKSFDYPTQLKVGYQGHHY